MFTPWIAIFVFKGRFNKIDRCFDGFAGVDSLFLQRAEYT